jgi:non-lysosomal glucosylceramidase
MTSYLRTVLLLLSVVTVFLITVHADDRIPEAAWRRPLGLALENPGHAKAGSGNIDDGHFQGAPVGGFGSGTFSRTYRGNFERWHVKAGVHKYQNVPANQFAVFVQPEGEKPIAQALSSQRPEGGSLSGWNWNGPAAQGEYASLYPKAWFAYKSKELPVTLTLEQFSPVIPNNYKESSYPVAVYNWYVANPSNKRVTVSVLFSWANMVGWFRDTSNGFYLALNQQNVNRYKAEPLKQGSMQGIVFDRLRLDPVSEDWDGQFAIATAADSGVEVTHYTTYLPDQGGAEVWRPFSTDGRLPNSDLDFASSGMNMAGAIAVKFTLAPGEKRTVPMVVAWDLPIVQFAGGRKWARHYTRFFDRSGTNAWKIARTALENREEWSKQIDAWQKPIIEDNSTPLWYRGMLFNELYELTDGGSFWAHELNAPANPNHPAAKEDDSFGFLECYDYPFYGSLDVRFYASAALARLWPEIEKQEMRQFADAIPESDTRKYVWNAQLLRGRKLVLFDRKTAGAAPHDLGTPQEDPFVVPNQYNWQSVTGWKDLNSKYVLMVWRDYVYSGSKDRAFLEYNYKAIKQAMEYLKQFDTDHDGVIENEGFPDQTYDNWSAHGESAYCGSLYLAALRATEEIAKILGDSATASENAALFKKGQASFIKKLWNGSYFNYDVGSSYKTDIMAEQLAGQWYATATGLGDIVPPEMRRSAMKKIFDYAVMKFANGQMGMLNGMGADGNIDRNNEQTEEVWVGTTWAVAATMLQEGMRDEAFTSAKGLYNVIWEKKGYWFRTPESWDLEGQYRAGMYMRPAAIWAMQEALEAAKKPASK